MANQQRSRQSNQRRTGGNPTGGGGKFALAAAGAVALVFLFKAHPFLTVLGTAVAAAAYVKFWLLPHRDKVAKAVVEKARTDKVGNDAEAVVVAVVERTPGLYTKFTSLNLGRNGDCDIAVLAANGLAAIEVKAGGGTCGWDGSVLTSGAKKRVVHGSPNPVVQARIQADLLSKAAGRPALPIVCVHDMVNHIWAKGARGEADVLICGRGYLPWALAHSLPGGPLSERDADRLASQLRRLRPLPPKRN